VLILCLNNASFSETRQTFRTHLLKGFLILSGNHFKVLFVLKRYVLLKFTLLLSLFLLGYKLAFSFFQYSTGVVDIIKQLNLDQKLIKLLHSYCNLLISELYTLKIDLLDLKARMKVLINEVFHQMLKFLLVREQL
jgi:hypothetical protein